ncbi:MAG: DUF2953 domain-containing protein [Pseudomonadota bacterium]
MSSIVLALLVVIATVLIVLAVMLILPVTLRVRASNLPSSSPMWRVAVEARPFGGVSPAITLHDSTLARSEKLSEKPPEKAADWSPSPAMSKRLPRMIGALPVLLSDILAAIRFEALSLDADIGLDDPADTGQLFGYVAAMESALVATPNIAIAIRPDFEGTRVSAEIAATLSVVPISLVAAGMRFGWQVFGPEPR